MGTTTRLPNALLLVALLLVAGPVSLGRELIGDRPVETRRTSYGFLQFGSVAATTDTQSPEPGQLFQTHILPLIPQQDLGLLRVLWIESPPASDSSSPRLCYSSLVVGAATRAQKEASLVPGSVQAAADPVAELDTLIPEGSVDLVVVLGTACGGVRGNLRDQAIAAAERATRPGGWLVAGCPSSHGNAEWENLDPGFQEASFEGLSRPELSQHMDQGWQYKLYRSTSGAPAEAEGGSAARQLLNAEDAVARAELAGSSQLHGADPGGVYHYSAEAPPSPQAQELWVSAGSLSRSTLQTEGQQADKALLEPKAASLKPVRPRKKSVEELADEAEMREAAEAEAAKLASASTQLQEASLEQPQSASSASLASTTSGAVNVGGAAEDKHSTETHESSTHRFRAGTSKANRALNANPAAGIASEAGSGAASVPHHKRVALPTSKLGSNPRMYGHSR